MDGRTGRDSELVAQAREGDLQAFDRLVARHRARVFGIARQIVSDPDTAQDLAQDALLRAYRSLGSLRNGDRIGQWLNTTVRRLGQEWLRGGRRRPEPVDGAVLLGVPGGFWSAPSEPPADVVARVHTALAVLSQRARRVMILHYLEGRSCDEIAAQLGLHPGSVKRILHYSRRKARKECDAMAEAEQGRRGPRGLRHWIDGSAGPDRIFDHLRPRLAQSVCLAVNKHAKSAQQIADDVAAHPEYVEEVAADLLNMEALVLPSRGKYLANFIAFDAEDWRRLMRMIPEPAAQVAARFASAQDRLRAAYELTPLAASGWGWDQVVWVIFAVLLANAAVGRWQQKVEPCPIPHRPGGGRYWLGGHEEQPDLPSIWLNGLNSNHGAEGLRVGNFWTWQIERERVYTSSTSDRVSLLVKLAEGPRTESELAASESERSALADLVRMQYASRCDHQYHLGVPLFTPAESEVLTPEMDAIVDPVMREIIQPALQGVNAQLDEMGYGHRREQYEEWHVWLSRYITGESLRYLLEQGVLPRPGDPAPPNFATLAWRPGIGVMSFGERY